MFLRSSPDFYKAAIIANSSSSSYSTSSDVFVTELRNPDTKAGFYIVRHKDSTGTKATSFKLEVDTSLGELTIPRRAGTINLAARESRVIVTDYKAGAIHLYYSTASVLFAGRVGSKDVLYLFGDANDTVEASFNASTSDIKVVSPFTVAIEPTRHAKETTTVIWSPDADGVAVVTMPGAILVLSNQETAGKVWTPSIVSADEDVYDSGSKSSVIVIGPYLVRNASLSEGHLKLRGDIDGVTSVLVHAGQDLKSVEWNGKTVKCAGGHAPSACAFHLDFEEPKISISKFSEWKYRDSLPEIQKGYGDGDWTMANKTNTTNPWKRYSGKVRLFSFQLFVSVTLSSCD